MAWLTLLIVAWGALAFGAIYDWARWPLIIACVAAGARGFARTVPRERRRMNGAILAGLALVALTVCVQLVPLDSHTLRRWSPAADAFLREYDLLYALPVVEETPFPGSKDPGLHQNVPIEPRRSASIPISGTITHPLSIDPAKTWVGLACFAAFGVMLLGLARGIGGRDLRVFAPGIVGLGVLMSMIGIIQKALWSGKVYGFWEPVNKGVVAFGPFINRNHFAGWMLLALPLAVGYFASLVAKGMVGVKPGWRSRNLRLGHAAAAAVREGHGPLRGGAQRLPATARRGRLAGDGAGAGAGLAGRARGAPQVPRGARRPHGLLDPPGRRDGLRLPSPSRKSWNSACRCPATRRCSPSCARWPSGGRRRRRPHAGSKDPASTTGLRRDDPSTRQPAVCSLRAGEGSAG